MGNGAEPALALVYGLAHCFQTVTSAINKASVACREQQPQASSSVVIPMTAGTKSSRTMRSAAIWTGLSIQTMQVHCQLQAPSSAVAGQDFYAVLTSCQYLASMYS